MFTGALARAILASSSVHSRIRYKALTRYNPPTPTSHQTARIKRTDKKEYGGKNKLKCLRQHRHLSIC